MRVNAKEAETRHPELLRAVAAGEEVVIANDGQVVARLVKTAETPKATSTGASILAMLATLEPIPNPQKIDEIHVYIAEERASWD